MGAIFLRSPRNRHSVCTATHLSIKMTITINGTLAYTLIKDSVADQKNLFEYAELCRDYVSITWTGSYSGYSPITNMVILTDIKYYDAAGGGGSEVTTGITGGGAVTQYGVDGYSNFMDGANDDIPNDAILISNYTQTNVPHKVGLGSNWLRIGGNYGIWKYNVEEVDEMLENYFKYIHNLEYQFIQTLKSIILLQNYCEVNKIQLINTCWNNIFDLVGELDDRHSSSNMFLTNDVIKKLKIGSSKQLPKTDLYPNALHWYSKIDWTKWLFYETSFYKRGGLGEFATLECGEENLMTGSHPKTSSQIKWAKFITEYINETIIKP